MLKIVPNTKLTFKNFPKSKHFSAVAKCRYIWSYVLQCLNVFQVRLYEKSSSEAASLDTSPLCNSLIGIPSTPTSHCV